MLKTKEELINNLSLKQEYFSKPEIKDYLNSLLELEFSVMRELISYEDREAIKNSAVYKDIAIYNIYYKAWEIAKNLNLDISIYNKDNKLLFTKDSYPLYTFDFTPDSSEIGIINIKQTLEDRYIRKLELERLKRKLKRLQKQINPYLAAEEELNLWGGQSITWNLNHNQQVEEYQNKIKELKHKKLTDEEKKQTEITNKVYEAFMNDYGLTENDLNVFVKYNDKAKYFPILPNTPLLTDNLSFDRSGLLLTIDRKYL